MNEGDSKSAAIFVSFFSDINRDQIGGGRDNHRRNFGKSPDGVSKTTVAVDGSVGNGFVIYSAVQHAGGWTVLSEPFGAEVV